MDRGPFRRWWLAAIWVGLALILCAVLMAGLQKARLRNLHCTQGRVAQILESRAANGTISSETRIVFIADDTAGNPRVEFILPPSHFGSDPRPGDEVSVAYPREKVNRAEVVSLGRIYGPAIAVGLTGMVLFDLGYAFWFVERRRSLDPQASKA